MTDKRSRQRDSLGNQRESLLHGSVSTETIDLESLFPKDITDSGSFEIQGEIWTTTFGRLIQALPIPVLLIDQSHTVIAANQACWKIGAAYEMMIGKPFSRLFPNQPDALQSESLVSTVFSSSKTSVWEALLKIDKNSMWGRLTFRSIRMRDQRCLMVLVEDLSLEKKQLLLDKKYKDDLEKRVKERAEQLRKLNEVLHCEIADRKRSEEALRLSEERYRRLFEDAPLIYVITRNEEGVPLISDCNELFLHSVGYTRGEVQGKPLADFYSPGSRTELLKRGGYARALAGEFLMGERELVRRDGTLIPTLLYTAPELDSSGQVTGTRAMFVDITERRRTEKALHENERRLSTLMFNLPGMAYRCNNDAKWTMEYVSEGCSTLTGYSPKHLVGNRTLSYADLIHPEDRERVWGQVQEALKEAAPFELEYRIRTRSGHEKWVWERGIGIPVEGAGDIKLEGFISDVTERKQMEHALQESEQRYRAVVENLEIGISVINPKMEIVAINRFFQKIYPHVKPGLGQHCYEIYNDPAGTSPCSYCPCVKTFEDGMVHESLTETPSGDRIRNFRIVSCPIKDAQGHVELVVELVEDVTEKRALQLQLAQAQKMEAVGTLAGGIAHDFNNLLTVVMGFSELLRAEKEQDDQEYADLSKILQAARSGAELVQRLLTFSRKVVPKPVPLNLNIRIVQVGNLLRRTISKMIEIQMDLSEDLSEINADPTQMEQILMNLCVNARDAMPEGGRLILGTKNITLDEEYCGVHSEARPGNYVLLAVSDTGHGISRATIDHIFEPFYTTKELGRGTGLGLAMVYGMVKQHSGYITCYSEVGRGTTFNVYFPALEGQVEPDMDKTAVMPSSGTETVLLVDDEELVRDLGARILSKAGYQVLIATNGKEALDLFAKERQRLSLVILDLTMPFLGGKECLKELLKLDPQVKVIVASGFSADASTDETLDLGAKGFVSKPFRPGELLRQVRKTLGQG